MPQKPTHLVEVLLQDQYGGSEEASERVWNGVQDSTAPNSFKRARDNDEDIAVEQSELANDALDFFSRHHAVMVDEFVRDLRESIGRPQQEAICELLATDWQTDRDGTALRSLKASIRDYTAVEAGARPPRVAMGHLIRASQASYDFLTIEKVMRATQFSLGKYLHLWLDTHPRGRSMGLHDVYFRRGIALSMELEHGSIFTEHDYLSSYSLSLTTAEKFAYSANGCTPNPTLIHTDYSTVESRAFFFAPFIPGMNIGQLELGVIPPLRDHRLERKAMFGSMHDYVIVADGRRI